MSVHSNDGKLTWSTKLDRIGELSVANKHLVFNNLGHLINADMLMEQYQQLDRNKAAGIDKVTKESYGINLNENIQILILKIRRGTYKPQPSRITEIPKEDGSYRPLAIACFEDKLIQLAVSKILSTLYEPLFLPCSYGFRAEKSCHDALRALMRSTIANKNGAILEIDIRKYFNTIPHKEIMKILAKKISDRRFLRLIEVLITAPIIENGKTQTNTCGCPQGSIVSPVLANIYLHYVVDEWFEKIKLSHLYGRAELIRYADDMVFTFQWYGQANRFYKALAKRLAKYGLELHLDKSQLVPAGATAAVNAIRNKEKLKTFNFLGFTCYWGKGRNGKYRLKYSSRRDRFASKLKRMRKFLRENLNAKSAKEVLKHVIRVVRGWINYHAVSDNKHSVNQFLERCKYLLHRWLNRRGGKRYVSWKKLTVMLNAVGFPTRWKTVSMFHTR